ncbi:hypothetical protein FACS189413_19080 [Bacteroidia bacterium]|nr:hypothetical protein FACS189413_19080 [Bacteroidia bacterium]
MVILLCDRSHWSRASVPLTVFMFVAGVHLWGQAIFQFHDYRLTALYDPIYSTATVFLYPVFYQYLRALTLPKAQRKLRLNPLFLPAIIMALWNITGFCLMSPAELNAYSHAALYGEAGFELSALVKWQCLNERLIYWLFDFNAVYALWFGLRHIRQVRNRLAEYYSNPDDHIQVPIAMLQYCFLFVALATITFCTIGRKPFIQTTAMLAIASFGHALMLFSIGYVAYKQHFTADDLERDMVQSDKAEKMAEQLAKKNADEQPQKIRLASPKNMQNQIIELFEKEELFRKPELSISDLAARLHTNRTYISRTINQEMQCTFSDFVNKYRVEYAKKLLESKQHAKTPITDIAEMSGFTHCSSFYRVFKSVENKSVKDYCKRLTMT